MISIKLVEQIDKHMQERMQEDLVRYETSHGIEVNYKQFCLTLSNQIEIIGILEAYTAFAEIYIDDIWVDARYRGRGYGKQLLDALWNQFEGQGFNNINLCTSAFQAPEFYKKCGFQLEFVRENTKNTELTKFFFVRFFENDLQNQGRILPKEQLEARTRVLERMQQGFPLKDEIFNRNNLYDR